MIGLGSDNKNDFGCKGSQHCTTHSLAFYLGPLIGDLKGAGTFHIHRKTERLGDIGRPRPLGETNLGIKPMTLIEQYIPCHDIGSLYKPKGRSHEKKMLFFWIFSN